MLISAPPMTAVVHIKACGLPKCVATLATQLPPWLSSFQVVSARCRSGLMILGTARRCPTPVCSDGNDAIRDQQPGVSLSKSGSRHPMRCGVCCPIASSPSNAFDVQQEYFPEESVKRKAACREALGVNESVTSTISEDTLPGLVECAQVVPVRRMQRPVPRCSRAV